MKLSRVIIFLLPALASSALASHHVRKAEEDTEDPVTTAKAAAVMPADQDPDVEKEAINESNNEMAKGMGTWITMIRHVENNKCVGFYGTTNWATLVPCTAAPVFRYFDYRLQVLMNGPVGMCLDARTIVGGTVIWVTAQTCDNTPSQDWYAVRVFGATDTYRWYNRAFGLYIDDLDSTDILNEDLYLDADYRYFTAQWFDGLENMFFEY